MNATERIEMELVTREVTLIRSALRLRAREVPPAAAAAYEQLADHMAPIGMYEFEPMQAAHICLALKEFADVSRMVGVSALAVRAQDLSDDFLRECFIASPPEEAGRLISQANDARKEGMRHEARSIGFIPRAAAAVGISRAGANDPMRPL